MVKFKSQATGDLVMLQAHARAVLQLLGKSPDEPGILETKDMPAALAVLKGLPQDSELADRQAEDDRGRQSVHDAGEHQDHDQDYTPEALEPAFINEPVSLRKRAWPLIMMIERAMAEGKPVMWNVTI